MDALLGLVPVMAGALPSVEEAHAYFEQTLSPMAIDTVERFTPPKWVVERMLEVAPHLFGFTLGTCVLFGSYRTLRWPALVGVSAWMLFLLLPYFLVRLAILGLESIHLHRSKTLRQLHNKLNTACNYQAWREAARKLDDVEKRTNWRHNPTSTLFDERAAAHTVRRLREAQEAGSAPAVMAALRDCCLPNAHGLLKERLYCRARSGAKLIVEQFVEEVVRALDWLARWGVKLDERERERVLRFALTQRACFGRPALMLSGGAALGKYHLGIIKALLEHDLLPRIVSGASMGSVVAALVCCRTNEELNAVFASQLQELYEVLGPAGPFEGSIYARLRRLFVDGRLYSAEAFRQRLQWFTRGMTFLEAFQHSGRVCAISCTPLRARGKNTGAPPLVLNHIDSPHVEIASAICASSAVPGLIDPPQLLQKGPDGTLIPWEALDAEDDAASSRMRDGSFESDLPVHHLAARYGVSFVIVSMVQPHIVPFWARLTGRPGRPPVGGRDGWRGGFFLALLENLIKGELQKCLRLIASLRLPAVIAGTDWSALFLQNVPIETGAHTGFNALTLTPDITPGDLLTALENVPSIQHLEDKIAASERTLWEALPMIRAYMDRYQAIRSCAHALGSFGQFEDALAVPNGLPSAAEERASASKAENEDGQFLKRIVRALKRGDRASSLMDYGTTL